MFQVVYSDKFLQHETGSHPECKERIAAVTSLLKEKEVFKPEKPESIKEEHLLSVHSKQLVEEIKHRSRQRLGTADNVFNSNTFEIALLACGSALKAAKLGEKDFAFSLARPPGHHAGKSFFGGFCYFNNIAFAVKRMQQSNGIERVLVLDFDLHHGNGTQNIFYNDESVFYLSLHQSPEFTFPGTGFEKENNSHVKNVPLQPGTTDEQYLQLLSQSFGKAFESFKPDLVAVSAGFDLFSSEASVGNRLAIENHETFFEIGDLVRKKTAVANIPCFAVLEGGYSLRDFPVNLFNFLNAFD